MSLLRDLLDPTKKIFMSDPLAPCASRLLLAEMAGHKYIPLSPIKSTLIEYRARSIVKLSRETVSRLHSRQGKSHLLVWTRSILELGESKTLAYITLDWKR